MLIDFVHPGDAYLPELHAYGEFLAALGHGCRIHRDPSAVPPAASVVWWMCGQVPRRSARRLDAAFHVHEYASASVPPMPWAKDRWKRWSQPRPQHRVFQNDWVRQRLGFADDVPYDLRDMGIAPAFLEPPASAPEVDHDFVYLGEMRRLQGFLPVFDALGRLGHRTLLVGHVPQDLAGRLGQRARVTVTGRVPYAQVAAQLRRARVGLNLVPDRAPFAFQTSTKLLEYCACGLPVLSTDYPWVRAFDQAHAGGFNYLPARVGGPALAQSLARALQAAPHVRQVDLRALAWPRLLASLRVWRAIGVLA